MFEVGKNIHVCNSSIMRMKGFTLAARVMAKFLNDIKYFIAKLSVCMDDRSL
jgi:hypothetical protein